MVLPTPPGSAPYLPKHILMTHYWVGFPSRDHVLPAVRGGFYKLKRGKRAPIARLNPG